jgi:uncharacterized damage-inducible protein DinB
MSKQNYINELEREAASTRKMLERTPMDKLSWAPHDKSSTLEKLLKHVANLPQWVNRVMQQDEIDFAAGGFGPAPSFESAEELTAQFDKRIAEAKEALEQASEEDFKKNFTIRRGDHIIYNMPKAGILRTMAFNHLIHHRGQLSVYLRLLDVPVPGMYGPSADDMAAR